jgi:predicted transcriptional regulator
VNVLRTHVRESDPKKLRRNPLMTHARASVDWKAVGRRLRGLRGSNVTQKEFARQLGISQGQVSRYEKGKSEVGAEVLLRIQEKFGKGVVWILTGREERGQR